jgi:hypothetical protein
MNESVLEDSEDLYNPTAVMTQDPVVACVTKKQKKEIRILKGDDSPDPRILLATVVGLYIYLRFLR